MRGDRIWPPAVVAAYALGALLGVPVLRVPAGLALIFLVPGWLVLRLVRTEFTWWYRLVLAAGISFALSLLSLLALELAGMRSTPVATGWLVAGLSTVLYLAGLRRPSGTWRMPTLPLRRLVAPLVAGVVTLGLAGAAWGVSTHTEQTASARAFTQVGLTPVTGSPRVFTASITNREGAGTSYRVVIEAPSAATRTVPVTLADGATWNERVEAGGPGKVEVTVYGGSSQTPASHRSVRAEVP